MVLAQGREGRGGLVPYSHCLTFSVGAVSRTAAQRGLKALRVINADAVLYIRWGKLPRDSVHPRRRACPQQQRRWLFGLWRQAGGMAARCGPGLRLPRSRGRLTSARLSAGKGSPCGWGQGKKWPQREHEELGEALAGLQGSSTSRAYRRTSHHHQQRRRGGHLRGQPEPTRGSWARFGARGAGVWEEQPCTSARARAGSGRGQVLGQTLRKPPFGFCFATGLLYRVRKWLCAFLPFYKMRGELSLFL